LSLGSQAGGREGEKKKGAKERLKELASAVLSLSKEKGGKRG